MGNKTPDQLEVAIRTFNSWGVDSLDDEGVLLIGDAISAKIADSLMLRSYGITSLLSADLHRAFSEHVACIPEDRPVDVVTYEVAPGRSKRVEFIDEPRTGKSGAVPEALCAVARRIGSDSSGPAPVRDFIEATLYHTGLEVTPNSPLSAPKFLALITRYRVLKTMSALSDAGVVFEENNADLDLEPEDGNNGTEVVTNSPNAHFVVEFTDTGSIIKPK